MPIATIGFIWDHL